MGSKITAEIEESVRNGVNWTNLPIHLKQILKNTPKDYDRFTFNYSLKNQLRYRGNLVRKIFRNEERYYELLIEKSISYLNIFPYHLADIVTKGLRVTPFNFYLEVIAYLLKNDKSYDTLPNFTAADCLRVLGIGRNEYLTLVGEVKTNSSKLFRKANPMTYLPKFPVKISIEEFWKVEVGFVLESDIKFVTEAERSVIDDLIDFGSQTAGHMDYHTVHSLYRKGLIYLDVPISGEDQFSIPPLKNFVMNRVSGDYFENILYNVFVTADEHMTISELANMLQINLDTVKHAVSLFCRLGFAKKKTKLELTNQHASWALSAQLDNERLQITPLNYHALLLDKTNETFINETFQSKNSTFSSNSISSLNESLVTPATPTGHNNSSTSTEYISSDGNTSDFSIINNSAENKQRKSSPDSDFSIEDLGEKPVVKPLPVKHEKRVGFLFDSTLTAFLMMGNLSPGLKNHAVTMFEVGKLCEESMDTFLTELEKVSLIDAEGEGDVSRYFAHAVILRSTIIALRSVLSLGLDLLRIECLENLDIKTRDRMLEKKYKFMISAAPLTSSMNQLAIPFFGQFYKSSENSHIWSRLFFHHLSGYGPPSLLLCKGTVLKMLPRLFLGYGKLLITIIHTDSYILSSENFKSLNEQLQNGCVLVQGYGIRQPGILHYEAFPFDRNDMSRKKWWNHRAIDKLGEVLNMKNTCGYVTFVNTGVPDIGSEEFSLNISLQRPKPRKSSMKSETSISNQNYDIKRPANLQHIPSNYIPDLQSPMDSNEITMLHLPVPHQNKTIIDSTAIKLKSPDEDHFANSPRNNSPSNVYRSLDCNELLEKELEDLRIKDSSVPQDECKVSKYLVSQSSVEIDIGQGNQNKDEEEEEPEFMGEEWTILDVNFGVPLFDVDCNTRICQYFKNLATEENLSKIQEINEGMNQKFTKFILQCLYFDDELMGLVKMGKLTPHPRINLAFENGKITYWNGK